MKKILITGANSYIGTSFEAYLKEKYPDDYAVDTVDMIDGTWRERSFCGCDAVFHVAGIAHVKETKKNAQLYYEINRDLAFEVAEKASREGVGQFVFLSSMSVYGKDVGVIDKKTAPAPKSNYGKSKLQAEQMISKLHSDKFKVCILRPPMVYGKGCKGNYPTLSKLAMKMPIMPYVKNERSMLYVGNLVEFVRLTIENEESGTFFPQNAEYGNTSLIMSAIAAAHGKKLILLKGFVWAIKFLGLFTGLVNKAYGNLTYDKAMSEYKSEYRIFSLEESIKLTESE